MATAVAQAMTVDEFLQLPEEDGISRELIAGEVIERPMTTRSPAHESAIARLTFALMAWFEAQPDLEGTVACGDARCRLSHNPDTTVGIDVALFEGEEAAVEADGARYFDRPPKVAVEVLSATDTYEEWTDKVQLYLNSGVSVVWLVEPTFQTITVFRRGTMPRPLNADDILDGEPELPGFRVPVVALFGGKHARR